jgi:predicted membrane protein (TIGR00267 family)
VKEQSYRRVYTINLLWLSQAKKLNVVCKDDQLSFVDCIRKQLAITHGAAIARRYFAMNAFDGLLPVLGILVGGFISLSHQTPSVIFQTSLLAILAASMAMFVSGITSSYLTEGAEQKRDMEKLEHALLTDLGDSMIWQASRTTTIVVSIINGLSPFLTGLITASPLFLVIFGLGIETAFLTAILMGLVILFIVGGYLGHISRTNIILYGIKTAAAGVAIVILTYFFSVIVGV